jgi:hypothetical protein
MWSSVITGGTNQQVFATRIDLANEAATRAAPPDQVSSGSNHDTAHGIVLPNGDLFVTYTATPAIVFKRGALGKLSTATETQIAAGPSQTGITSFTGAPFAVLSGDFAVAFYFDFFATTPQSQFGSWAYRRYRHADSTFLDPAPQFAAELQQQPNMAFHAAAVGDGTVWITYVTAPHVGNQTLQVVRFRPATTSFDQGSQFPVGSTEQINQVHVLPSRDGTVWVFWAQASGIRFIRWTNGSWSPASLHPSTLPGDAQPSALQTRDGAIWLCWVRAGRVPIVVRFDPQQAIWGPPRTVRISSIDFFFPVLMTPTADQLLLAWVGTQAGIGRATYKRLVMTL